MRNGSGRSWIRKEFRPAPWRRWSAIGLAPEPVTGSVRFQIKHSRVGGPGGQAPGPLAGSGRAQRLQQPGDAWLLVRAEGYPARGVASQQGPGRLIGAGRAQFLEQLGDVLGGLEAGTLGGAGGQ